MPNDQTSETFFRPETEVERIIQTLPARLHNALRLALEHAPGEYLFVPIRSMQYLTIVESQEVLFVDALGGYAHQDGVGGRLIRIAWRPQGGRDSLSAPVPYEIVYYFQSMQQTQMRLLVELGLALEQQRQRRRRDSATDRQCRILPFRPISASDGG